MLKKVFCFGVFILMGLCFLSGCEKESSEWILEMDSCWGEPATPYYCGYKSKTKEFAENDVNLYFYYGTIYEDYSFLASPYREAELNINICFVTEQTDKIIIKIIPADIFAANCNTIIENGKIVYTCFEKIAIPTQAMPFDKGSISFRLYEEFKFDDGRIQEGSGNIVSFYYLKLQNKILLSNIEMKGENS